MKRQLGGAVQPIWRTIRQCKRDSVSLTVGEKTIPNIYLRASRNLRIYRSRGGACLGLHTVGHLSIQIMILKTSETERIGRLIRIAGILERNSEGGRTVENDRNQKGITVGQDFIRNRNGLQFLNCPGRLSISSRGVSGRLVFLERFRLVGRLRFIQELGFLGSFLLRSIRLGAVLRGGGLGFFRFGFGCAFFRHSVDFRAFFRLSCNGFRLCCVRPRCSACREHSQQQGKKQEQRQDSVNRFLHSDFFLLWFVLVTNKARSKPCFPCRCSVWQIST